MVERTLHEANRRAWNAATRAHNTHKGDQAAFFREGGSTLFEPELQLLGDVAGRRVVHLQCNAGQDSLSLARLGAQVTGVDISDEAIDFARRLSADSGVPATFHRSDLYAWLEETDARFDVAFTSYGVLGWLSDLRAWARGVARILAPGGRLVVQEFHPVFLMMADDGWRLGYPYSGFGRPLRITDEHGVGDYVAGFFRARGETPPGEQDFVNPHPDHTFVWGLADVIQPLLDAGLRLERLEEQDWTPYPIAPGMRETEPDRWRPPEGVPALPLMFGLVVRRPS